MPELPDVTLYIEALRARLLHQRLERCIIVSPFLLRTAQPPLEAVQGRRVVNVRRIGKRIAIGLEGELWLLMHLMIAGRLHWFDRGSRLSKRAVLARFEFTSGLEWRVSNIERFAIEDLGQLTAAHTPPSVRHRVHGIVIWQRSHWPAYE